MKKADGSSDWAFDIAGIYDHSIREQLRLVRVAATLERTHEGPLRIPERHALAHAEVSEA